MSRASISWSSAGWDCTDVTERIRREGLQREHHDDGERDERDRAERAREHEVEDVGADAGAQHPLVATDRSELLHRDEEDPEQHECDRGANHALRLPPPCEGFVRW